MKQNIVNRVGLDSVLMNLLCEDNGILSYATWL